MKLKNYLKSLSGLLMAIAFASCSSDNPANDGGTESPDYGYSDSYVSVSIEMPTASGTRAEDAYEDKEDFSDGSENESLVNNVLFFFFDDNNNVVDIRKLTSSDFKTPNMTDDNPFISTWGTVEVRLKAGLTYKKVAVAVNTPIDDANSLKSQIKTFEDLEKRSMDYVSIIGKDNSSKGKNIVMSSSVYFDTSNVSDNPADVEKICMVKINDDNIYTSAERSNIDNLIKDKKKNYVDIFVERVVARVDVNKPVFDMDKFYVYKEDGKEVKTITICDNVNSHRENIVVRPVIKGMRINVLAPKTKLIKPIDVKEVGYGIGTGDYKAFKWNDPANKRSYWASTSIETESETESMIYYSWEETENQNVNNKISEYVHPNTQDYKTDFGDEEKTKDLRPNEGGSLNTKIMVIAELHKYKEDDNDELIDDGVLDLVKFGSDYMYPTGLLAHVANLINIAVRTYGWDYAGFQIDGVDLSENELNNVKIVVNNSFIGGDENTEGFTGIRGSKLKLEMLDATADGDADWEATVKPIDNTVFTKDEIRAQLVNKDKDGRDIITDEKVIDLITDKIVSLIEDNLNSINSDNPILYWKGGKTYYFTNIRHQGFYGLAGNSTDAKATDFLYGVVRNHIYNINLEGVYGLGTPVIDPTLPINPDRPKNERPSYIKARINILPWRVVTNNATIH